LYLFVTGILLFRLQGFILKGFNSANQLLFTHQDKISKPQEVYTVQLTNPVSDVSRINVEATTIDPYSKSKILTICELQVFGGMYVK
jgi:hypothetical protein